MSALEWKDSYKNSVVYKVYPKSFCDSDGDGLGDLAGITSRIPYLSALGVDILALSSILETNADIADRGCTDYMKINPAIGTEDDLAELIRTAHHAGMKVFLSLNLTATSSMHKWFIDASSKTMNPYREYYVWKEGRGKNGKRPPNSKKNRLEQAGWSRSLDNGEWYRNAFGDQFPSLNYQNLRLRKEFVDVFRFWREKGVDGFIIDHAFFSMKAIVLSDLKPLYRTSIDLFISGRCVYQIVAAVRNALGKDFPIILNAVGVKPGIYPYLLTNEKPTGDSVIAEQLISDHRLGMEHSFSKKKFFHRYLSLQKSICKSSISFCLEDERHHRLISSFVDIAEDGRYAAKMLGTLLLTATATPVIYQGEEIGMTDYPLKKNMEELLAKGNLHTCSPMQWDNAPYAAFSEAFPYLPINDNFHTLNVMAESQDKESVLAFYKKLIAYRKSSSALTMGDFEDYSKKKVLAYIRSSDTERLLVIANTSNAHLNFNVPSPLLEKEAICEISNYAVVSKPIFPTMGLRPYEIRIFRMKAPLPKLN